MLPPIKNKTMKILNIQYQNEYPTSLIVSEACEGINIAFETLEDLREYQKELHGTEWAKNMPSPVDYNGKFIVKPR